MVYSQKPLGIAGVLVKEWSRDLQTQAQNAYTNEGCKRFILSAEQAQRKYINVSPLLYQNMHLYFWF